MSSLIHPTNIYPGFPLLNLILQMKKWSLEGIISHMRACNHLYGMLEPEVPHSPVSILCSNAPH
jgi:hypothetical protein